MRGIGPERIAWFLALLPGGSSACGSAASWITYRGNHCCGHEPGADCLEPEEFRARHAQAGPRGNPQATVFLCGAYQFSGDVGSGLLDALPEIMTLTPAIDDPLRDVITLLSRELVHTEPAQQIVLDRLLDLLLVLAIRSEFRRSVTAPRWYRASADPRLSAALRAMHENAAPSPNSPTSAACPGPHSRGPSGRRSARPPCST